MKYVLLYESSDDVLEKAPLHGAAHRAWWKQFLEDGAMADPFVLNGVVKSWRIAEWLEAIAP